MRLVTWVFLLALAVAGIAIGRPGIGFAIAGLKALAVGLEFMELKQAARLHAVGFAMGVAVVSAALVAIVGR